MSRKICGFQSRKVAAFLAGLLLGLVVGGVCGCSSLQPATKSQSMTVTALGFPAITVVTTTSQAATNDGSDCIKAHLKTAFSRLGAASRAEAVSIAQRMNLLKL